MSNISSIHHQKKSNRNQEKHNDRTFPPSYLVRESKNNVEYNRSAADALKLRNSMIDAAMQIYEDNCTSNNKKFQAKSYEWGAVCNIKAETTMAEIEEIAKYYEKELGFQCYQIAIHRDEGHLVEKNTGLVWQSAKHFYFDARTGIYYKGECKNPNDDIEKQIWKKSDEILAQNIDELTKQFEIKINHHAHLEFITLDKKTGKNRSRELWNNRKKMSEIQDEISKILQMERGKDAHKSKTKRIEPRAYATLATNENRKRTKQIEKTQSINKAFEKAFETLDKEFGVDFEPNIPQATQNYIDKFNEVAKERDSAKAKIAELEAKITEIKEDYKKERERIIAENKALQEQGKDKIYTQQDHQNLKKQYEEQIAELEAKITELEKQINAKDDKIAELEEERRNVIIEFVKHQNWVDFYKKIPESIGDLIEFCEKVVDRLIELQDVNEAWEQYFKENEKNAQNDDGNTEQNDTPTNAQNDDSNTIYRKNH